MLVNTTAAKLDDVTKILTDLKTDLDTPKLSSQRTSPSSFHVEHIPNHLQNAGNSSSSSKCMVGTLQTRTQYSHKTYDGFAQQHQDER